MSDNSSKFLHSVTHAQVAWQIISNHSHELWMLKLFNDTTDKRDYIVALYHILNVWIIFFSIEADYQIVNPSAFFAKLKRNFDNTVSTTMNSICKSCKTVFFSTPSNNEIEKKTNFIRSNHNISCASCFVPIWFSHPAKQKKSFPYLLPNVNVSKSKTSVNIS